MQIIHYFFFGCDNSSEWSHEHLIILSASFSLLPVFLETFLLFCQFLNWFYKTLSDYVTVPLKPFHDFSVQIQTLHHGLQDLTWYDPCHTSPPLSDATLPFAHQYPAALAFLCFSNSKLLLVQPFPVSFFFPQDFAY